MPPPQTDDELCQRSGGLSPRHVSLSGSFPSGLKLQFPRVAVYMMTCPLFSAFPSLGCHVSASVSSEFLSNKNFALASGSQDQLVRELDCYFSAKRFALG